MHAPQSSTISSPQSPADKWEVLRNLSAARVEYGLTDRDLNILQALISFHPGAELDLTKPLVVHPSNQSICDRLHGMASSTMRRHLARLVDTRVILRRDSPNGKRYARRYGGEKVAYGFDLSPLARRALEFENSARAAKVAEQSLKRLRETVSLMRRDLAALTIYGQNHAADALPWDAYEDMAILTARSLRRKLKMADLVDLEKRLAQALQEVKAITDPLFSEKMGTNDAQNGQHYQSSKKDTYESEEPLIETVLDPEQSETKAPPRVLNQSNPPDLKYVLVTCPEIQTFTQSPIRSWPEMIKAADSIAMMMGIAKSLWLETKNTMGPGLAATTLAAMLERYTEIRSPGAYLRKLTNKAATGTFSPGPMLRSLAMKAV